MTQRLNKWSSAEKIAARSITSPAANMRSSRNLVLTICTPTGKPFHAPVGTDRPGRPLVAGLHKGALHKKVGWERGGAAGGQRVRRQRVGERQRGCVPVWRGCWRRAWCGGERGAAGGERVCGVELRRACCELCGGCPLYNSPSPRDRTRTRLPVCCGKKK